MNYPFFFFVSCRGKNVTDYLPNSSLLKKFSHSVLKLIRNAQYNILLSLKGVFLQEE
jgi:hypothetical protein